MKIFGKEVKKRYVFLLFLIATGAIGLYFFYFRQYEILPDSTLFLFDDIKLPSRSDRVMIFSPHPDDETLGAGAFIKKTLESGASVEVVIVTDGNKHGLKEKRHEETLNAMKILGLPAENVIFYDYPDGKLIAHEAEVEQSIKNDLVNFNPTFVLTTHPADTHPDHSITGKVVQNSIKLIEKKPRVYEYLVHYPRYPKPQGFHPRNNLLPPTKLITFDRQWKRLLVDEETLDLKHEAIFQYRTQLSIKNPLLRQLLLSFIRQNEIFSIVNE